MGKEEADHVMKKMEPTSTIVAILRSFDKDHEGGIHKDFPPIPAVVLFLAKWVWSWPNRKWWKWSPCDRNMRRKELGGLGDSGEEAKRTDVVMTQE